MRKGLLIGIGTAGLALSAALRLLGGNSPLRHRLPSIRSTRGLGELNPGRRSFL